MDTQKLRLPLLTGLLLLPMASLADVQYGKRAQLQWIIDTNHNGVADLRTNYGEVSDKALPGDFNGDGKADLAVLRDTNGKWQWIIDTNRNGKADKRVDYGKSSDQPVVGDFNGDGKADIAVLREVSNQWQWIVDTNLDGRANIRVNYGKATDRPVPADYNGDGKTDLAVVRKVSNQWQWIVDTNLDGTANHRVNYGKNSDIPIPADFSGDKKADLAVLRMVGTQWQWIIDTNFNGTANLRVNYGLKTDIAVPADYNGDGKADIAVVRAVSYVNGRGFPALAQTLDQDILNFLRDEEIPGATVAVSKNGRLIYNKSFGYANVNSRIPMLPHHRTRIGSVSKIVTATAFMKLAEQRTFIFPERKVYGQAGILNSMEYMNAIKKGVTLPIPGSNNSGDIDWYLNIQVRHLLSHTAGFQGAVSGAAEVAEALGIQPDEVTYSQIHQEFLATRALLHAPGTRGAYENHNIGTAGLVIEAIAGMPYRKYVENSVFKPIGMQTRIVAEDGIPSSSDSSPHVYTPNGAESTAVVDVDASTTGLPKGGWTANAGDMVRFMLATDKLPNHKDVLTPSTLDLMETRAFPSASGGAFALGWRIACDSTSNNVNTCTTRVEHNGTLKGGRARIVKYKPGYISSGGEDLGGINVAVLLNIKSPGHLRDLIGSIALATSSVNPDPDYDLY